MSNNETPDGEEEEEQAQPVFPNRGPNREGMVSGYLPEDEDWLAKTHLDVNDPAAVSALRNLDQMFPEVDDLQPLVDDFLDDFLKSKTSVKGMSRDEYKNILMGMFGASGDDEESSALKLVAADDD